MDFYLGTHMVKWLRITDVPLFVSHRRLQGFKRLPVSAGSWALDSGGFTELTLHGTFRTTPAAYVDAVHRYADEIGRMDFAAPQDWMCEPHMLARTGLTVDGHQQRTVHNYLQLAALAPELPFMPVLQGWTLDDYLRCVDLYAACGVDVTDGRRVGLGSVCRRQSTDQIEQIAGTLARGGIALHGFGVKTLGLARFAQHLVSADSLAWSYNARRNPPMDGHTHLSCASCLPWALRWRQRITEVAAA